MAAELASEVALVTTQLEVSRLTEEVFASVEQRPQTVGEKDKALSLYGAWTTLVTPLSLAPDSIRAQLVHLQPVTSNLSWDINDLSDCFRSLQLAQSEGIESLGRGLFRVSPERNELQVALTWQQASEEDQCQTQEQQMIECLTPKVASFFQMGFVVSNTLSSSSDTPINSCTGGVCISFVSDHPLYPMFCLRML